MNEHATSTDVTSQPSGLEAVAASLILTADPPQPNRTATAPAEATAAEPEDDEDAVDEGGGEAGEGRREQSADDEEGDPLLDLLDGSTDDAEDDTPSDVQTEDPEDADRVFTVKVDGETREVPLRELLRAYSLGTATQKRLQEATELRRRAYDEGLSEAQTVVQQAQQQAQVIALAHQTLQQSLFAPRVERPSDDLQETDPLAYALQSEQWRRDQERINQQRHLVGQALEQAQALERQRRQMAVEYHRDLLLQRLPALREPERAAAFRAALSEAAAANGFSPEELQAVVDHRHLLVLAKANAYDRLMAGRRTGTGKRVQVAEKSAPRTLPPGGRNPVAQSARRDRQMEALKAKARETGHVDDVAATLLVPHRPARRGRR